MPLKANSPAFVSKRRSRSRPKNGTLRANAPAFVSKTRSRRRSTRRSQKVASNTYNALWKEIKNLTVGK